MKIEEIQNLNVIFMRRFGAYGAENEKLMDKFKSWTKANNLWNDDTIILGIAQDNPSLVKPEDCRYDVCLVVSDNNNILDTNVMCGMIKGGKYAVFKIHHTREAVQKAWDEIFYEVSKAGHLLDEKRPILERYIVQMVNNHYCEICIPIQES